MATPRGRTGASPGKTTRKKKPAEEPSGRIGASPTVPEAAPVKFTADEIKAKAIAHLTGKLESGTIVGLELKMLLDLTKEEEDADLLGAGVPPTAPFPVSADDLPFHPDSEDFVAGRPEDEE